MAEDPTKSSANPQDDPKGTQGKVQDDPNADPNADPGPAGETPEEKAEREEAERLAREEKDKEYKSAHTKWTTHAKQFEEEAEAIGVPLEDYFAEVRRLAHLGHQQEQEKAKAAQTKKSDTEDKEFDTALEELADDLGTTPEKLKPFAKIIKQTTEAGIMEKLKPHFQRNLGLDLQNKYSEFIAHRRSKDPDFAITEEMKRQINSRVAELVKEDSGRYEGKGSKNVYNRAFLDLLDDDGSFAEKVLAATKASKEKREKDKTLLNVDRGKPGAPGAQDQTLKDKIKGSLFPQAIRRKQERG